MGKFVGGNRGIPNQDENFGLATQQEDRWFWVQVTSGGGALFFLKKKLSMLGS